MQLTRAAEAQRSLLLIQQKRRQRGAGELTPPDAAVGCCLPHSSTFYLQVAHSGGNGFIEVLGYHLGL